MASPVSAAMSAGSSIGRRFSLVSLIPATLFVLYLTTLLAAGAWTGPFRPRDVALVADGGWSDLGRLLTVSLLLAACLHPFTFGLTQILEGYWGAGRLGLLVTRWNVARHRARYFRLEAVERRTAEAFRHLVAAELGDDVASRLTAQQREQVVRSGLVRADADDVLPAYLRLEAVRRERRRYPPQIRRVMPTRLGNSLRRHEDTAGRRYELDTITVSTHLSQVAEPAHQAYVEDQRDVLDLAVNLWAMSGVATVVTAVLLADDGLWSLLALAPFAVAYLAYLGAVGAADDYAAAMRTVIDLDRFRLYEALHLPLPATLAEERTLGRRVVDLLSDGAVPSLTYVHPAPPAVPDGTAPAAGPSPGAAQGAPPDAAEPPSP
jgi:hypothetical protein